MLALSAPEHEYQPGLGDFCVHCGQSRQGGPHGEQPERPKPVEPGPVVAMVHVDKVLFHPRNIRRDLGDLRELAASIKQDGLLQPLLLHKAAAGLQIVDGHRRVAAARQAGVKRLPAMVVAHLDDDEVITRALSTGMLKKDISHEERRVALTALRDEFGFSTTLLSQQFAVSVATIYNWLRPEDELRNLRKRDRVKYPGRVNMGRLRSVVDDWRGRDLSDDAKRLLAAVEELLSGGEA